MAFDNSSTKAVACDHPQKGMTYHLSLAQLDKPYIVGKLSIRRVKVCNFSSIGRNTEEYEHLKVQKRHCADSVHGHCIVDRFG